MHNYGVTVELLIIICLHCKVACMSYWLHAIDLLATCHRFIKICSGYKVYLLYY